MSKHAVRSPDGLLSFHSKYKFMEGSLERTKQNLKAKIPDIEKTLELVRVLQEKQVGERAS